MNPISLTELPESWKPFIAADIRPVALGAADIRPVALGAAPAAMSLVTKLTEVMAAVHRLPKRGRNEHFGYDYATEADIVEAIRGELASRHVLLLPGIDEEIRLEIGRTTGGALKILTQLKMTFTFVDGDTGESLCRSWRGSGLDSEDKGLYKAMTGAEKYWLLKTFLIPTGDDPEREPSAGRQSRRGSRQVLDEGQIMRPKRAITAADQAAARAIEMVLLYEVRPAFKPAIAEIVTSTGETLPLFRPAHLELARRACHDLYPVKVTTAIGKKTQKEYVSDLVASDTAF